MWTNNSGDLNSILCASSYGAREFSLPSGEFHRIRFILPMQNSDVDLLVKEKGSPFYNSCLARNDELRSYFLEQTGCVPRVINDIITKLPPDGTIVETKQLLEVFMDDVIVEMTKSVVDRWLPAVLQKNDFALVNSSFEELLKGRQRFSLDNKQLYDSGLVTKLSSTSNLVKPISVMAHRALQSAIAREFYNKQQSIEEKKRIDPDGTGKYFEKCIHNALVNAPPNTWVSAFQLKSCKSSMINARKIDTDDPVVTKLRLDVDLQIYLKGFGGALLRNIAIHPSLRILWVPEENNALFDGIVTCSKFEDNGLVYIIDPSITDPLQSGRRKKCRILSGLRNELATNLSIHEDKIHTVLFWDGSIKSITNSKEETRANIPDDAYLVDGESCKTHLNINIGFVH